MKRISILVLTCLIILPGCYSEKTGKLGIDEFYLSAQVDVINNVLSVNTSFNSDGSLTEVHTHKISDSDDLYISYNSIIQKVSKKKKKQYTQFSYDENVYEVIFTFKRSDNTQTENTIILHPPAEILAPLANSVYLPNEDIAVRWQRNVSIDDYDPELFKNHTLDSLFASYHTELQWIADCGNDKDNQELEFEYDINEHKVYGKILNFTDMPNLHRGSYAGCDLTIGVYNDYFYFNYYDLELNELGMNFHGSTYQSIDIKLQ